MEFKSFRIGNLKLANPLILAPMVDVTDLPYRLLCRRMGAALAYTEMLYIDAILHENEKTRLLMKTNKEDSPVGLQITGNSEEEFETFVKSRKWKDFELIDLNCGCPSVRITGNQAGSYLLRNPDKIGRMMRILKKTGKAVSAKIRLGFSKNNVLQVVREIEKSGADALGVHARLAIHGGNVKADWNWIRRVKQSVKIPVIGNGDIFSGADAEKMLRETECDGVMIARGAIGDPLIFSRILRYLETGGEPDVVVGGNLKIFREYIKLEKEVYGEKVDLSKVKYVGGKFLRGFKGASRKREELMRCKSLEEIGFAVKFLN